MGLLLLLFVVGAVYFVLKQKSGQETISVIIVPHHDIVERQRLEVLKKAAGLRQEPKRILLISPNHYDSGEAAIQLYDEPLTSNEGTLNIDQSLLGKALETEARVEKPSFINEHGIKLLLPDIAKVFPNTPILPVILKSTATQAALDEFVQRMQANCTDCLVIASVDMSHYQPYAISELHDEATIHALRSLNSNFLLSKTEADSPQSLYIAAEWAKRTGTLHFSLQEHTNSTQLIDDLYAEGTTHIFGWYDDKETTSKESKISFTAVGDVMFAGDMNVESQAEGRKLVSQLGDRVLWGTDAVIGNLEGPITEGESVLKAEAPAFRFSPRSTTVLDYLHFTAMNLANNHTLDGGEQGYEDTEENLRQQGIASIDADNSVTEKNGDAQLTIFGVNAYESIPDNLLDRITDASTQPSHYVLVYVHWGKEFEKQPTDSQRELAHLWIDAGADAVIGTGSHITQTAEVYKQTPIFYSLGNFIYSKTYNPGNYGYVVSGVFSEKKLSLVVSAVDTTNKEILLRRTKESDEQLLKELPNLRSYLTDDRGGLRFTFTR